MQPFFSFQITALDPDALHAQVSSALEAWTELLSRERFPKLWSLADKLNRREKAHRPVQKRRRVLYRVLGVVDWILALILLIPGLMEPQELLVPLLVGAAGFGGSVVLMWRYQRTLLGILNLVMGAILCLGALENPEELGSLLLLGISGLVIGLAALLIRTRQKKTPFDKAAQQLLQERDKPEGMELARITFSPEGLTIHQEGEEAHTTFPYSVFELVVETDDLLLPVYQGAVTVLQKKDLLTGTLPELREFLREQTQYVQKFIQGTEK